jgi:hypothetical protein
MQADKASTVAALNQRKAPDRRRSRRSSTPRWPMRPGVAAEQGQIEREYQVLKDQYDKLLSDREQVRINSQAQTETDAVKFSVIDPPTQPRAPTAPNRPLLLTGVLIARPGRRRRRCVRAGQAAHDLRPPRRGWKRRAGMPVIGSIGEVVTAAQIAMRRQRLTCSPAGSAGLASRSSGCSASNSSSAAWGPEMNDETPRRYRGSLLERAAEQYALPGPAMAARTRSRRRTKSR